MKKLVLIIIISLILASGCTIEPAASDFEVVETKVKTVVDGDTIKALVDGELETIRFIGVNTPEVARGDQDEEHYGPEASKYSKEILSDRTIYLTKDQSNRDQYGRLLRFIWLEQPTDPRDEDEIRGKMFNAILLEEGYAHTVKYEPDVTHYDLFREIQAESEENNRGMWAPETVEKVENSGLIITEFDKRKEMVVITNTDDFPYELEGYTVVSVKDAETQYYEFGEWLLEPSQSVRIYSGPDKDAYSYDLFWSEETMFSNSKLDPVALLNPEGQVVDQVDK